MSEQPEDEGHAPRIDRYKWIFQHSAVSLWEQDISELRQKLKALRASGVEHLAEYLDAHPEFVEEAIHSIKVVDVNDATLELFEAESKEPLQGPLSTTLDPAATPSFKELILAIDQGREVLEVTSQARTMRGRRLDLIIRRYIPTEDSPYPYVLVNVIDISERKYLERKVEEEASLLFTFLDNNPDLFYVKDRNGRFIMANKAFVSFIGAADAGGIIGKTDEDLFPADVAERHREIDARIVGTGQPLVNLEEQLRSAAGEECRLLVTKLPITGSDGGVIGIAGIGRDITLRRQVEERNIRLATLVESVSDAIVSMDSDGVVTSWNRGAEKVFGYTAGEVVGGPLASLVPPGVLKTITEVRERIYRGESVENLELELLTKDGKTVPLSMTASPIRDSSGKIVGTATVSRDVSARKALLAQIIRAQRLESLGTLAAGIAHQFNNINAVVKGYLDLLLLGGELSTSARTYAQEMLAGVQRAVAITERLQGLTRAAPSSTESVALGDLVRSVLPLVERQLEADGATLVTDLRENPAVKGTPTLLNFIVTSLLTNSLHALIDRPEKRVTVRTRTVSGYAMLEVTDTGCGISDEDLPRIFTPFFTTKGEWATPPSPQMKVKGVGLSLAVCQSTVAEYGGWIEVESTPDVGSTFRVHMPLQSS
jgi:two-component system, cell cycle sensor histidine kinase and response regulator CckA